MAAFPIPGQPWTRQPGQFVPLGGNDSLSRNLLWASGLTALDATRAPTDYLSGRTGSRSGVTLGADSRLGIVPSFNGSAISDTGPVDLSPFALVSITLFVRLASVASIQVLAEYSPNYNSAAGFLIYSDPSVLIASVSSGSGLYSEYQSAALSANTTYAITALFDRNGNGVNGVVGVYVNGRFQARTGGTANFGGGPFAASQTIYLGARAGPNFGIGGIMGPCLVHGRHLGYGEIVAASDSVWRVLAPRSRVAFRTAAAPAPSNTGMFLALMEGEG